MLEHHLQRDIVYRLAFAPGMRFSELKPDSIESKLFTYHLKKVVSAGYVAKTDNGQYELTPEGRRLGLRVNDTQYMSVDRAYSVLFLAIRRKHDGAWLLYRRNTHPLFGLTGFMHATPSALRTTPEQAALECKEKTGLSGDFKIVSSGYFRVFIGEELESFTHFTLLVCDDIQGELVSDSKLADYYWDVNPNFASPAMLPNMAELSRLYSDDTVTFIEKTFRI